MKYSVKTKVASILMAGAMMATAAVPTMASTRPVAENHKVYISTPNFSIRSNPDGSYGYTIHTFHNAAYGGDTTLLNAVKEIASAEANRVKETITGVPVHAETYTHSEKFAAVPKITIGNITEDIAHAVSDTMNSLDNVLNPNQKATWYPINTKQDGNTKIVDIIPVE